MTDDHWELRTDGGIRFVKVSGGYIDVYFGAHCSDCIDTGDNQVTTAEQFQAVVNEYLSDPDNDLEAHWDSAFRATITEGMS